MATTKPRITVTLEPEAARVLAEFAGLQGCSQSAVLAEIWGEALPTVARVVALMKEANAARGMLADRVKDLAIEAQVQMAPHAKSLAETFDAFEDEIRRAVAPGTLSAPAETVHGTPHGARGTGSAE